VRQYGIDASLHAGVGSSHTEIGQRAESIERVFGIIMSLQGVTWPSSGFGDETLDLGVGEHLRTRGLHPRVVLRLVEKVHPRAIAGPGFI
jgi:hypothetical protein